MATDRRKGQSDAELRDAVLAGWHRLGSLVRSESDQLGALAKLTGMPFRQLDMVRQVRNRIAHPDQPVPRERLMAALRTIADAELRLAARKAAKKSSGKPANRRPAKGTGGRARKPAPQKTRRATAARRGPAKPVRRRPVLVPIAIVVLVAVAGVVLVVLLQN